ncbi:unnamed protein product, partial [Polarella glacialis]
MGGELQLQPFLQEAVSFRPSFDRGILFLADRLLHRSLPPRGRGAETGRWLLTVWFDGRRVDEARGSRWPPLLQRLLAPAVYAEAYIEALEQSLPPGEAREALKAAQEEEIRDIGGDPELGEMLQDLREAAEASQPGRGSSAKRLKTASAFHEPPASSENTEVLAELQTRVSALLQEQSITDSEIMAEIQNPDNADAYFVLPSQLNGAVRARQRVKPKCAVQLLAPRGILSAGWDNVFTFDKCCTETEEGIQFDLRRRNFVADMVRRGATVHFDIRHVSGGRTGAVASRALSARSTVLRVPSSQVYSLKSVPAAIHEAARRHDCDAHAVLGLGLALERTNPASILTDWIRLLPLTFANVLWFSERQLQLVNSTFFSYIVQNWYGDLDCMSRTAKEMSPALSRGRKVTSEDLKWALSVVKTRGFAFEGTRESTMLIPLADFLNHHTAASVRTATLAEDALRFVSTRDVMPGDELCIDYAQASNLEFLVRYGFRVEDNPYGGRQFELGGEPLQ